MRRDGFYLMTNHNSGLFTIVILQHTLQEPSSSVRTPVGLLRVVGFAHGLPLHVHGDHQVGRGVGVRLPGLAELDVARHGVGVCGGPGGDGTRLRQ